MVCGGAGLQGHRRIYQRRQRAYQVPESGDLVYEIWQPAPGQTVDCPGKIDHMCFESTDIEADYAFCKAQGYRFEEEGIQEMPEVWEKGVRFFKIMSPSGEPVEFCQIL